MAQVDLSIAIGGAAGQGIATPGDILARIFVRRGLHLNAYNAYQSIVRGGHIFLTLRTSDAPVLSFGDELDVLIALNQDTMNRHLRLMQPGSSVLYNKDKIKPDGAAPGVQLAGFSVKELAPGVRGDLVQNTIALAAVLRLIGVEFKILEDILALQFKRKGAAVIAENVGVARAGYDYAASQLKALPVALPDTGKKLAFFEGNQALAMGGAAAGVRFYCAYPMSPSSGVLALDGAPRAAVGHHGAPGGRRDRGYQYGDRRGPRRLPRHVRDLRRRFRLDDRGTRRAAAMMEIPVVCINVQRAGPATGVPTKTEQGDLWQAMGAGQGDYPAHHRRADHYTGLFQDRAETVQSGRQVSVPGHHSIRSIALRRPIERRSGGAGLQCAHRAWRGDWLERRHAAAQRRRINATRSTTAASRRARCLAHSGTSMWSPPTITTRTAC